jgi:GntR family transcriptional repressor for pyruvate dehydrogenase complex
MRRRTLSADVADQLLELIAGEDGETEVVLPAERVLGNDLGVSRNVLREALAMLDGLRVVETRGKSRVADPQRARAQMIARIPGARRRLATDPLEVRRMLEPEAAALAARRGTPAAVAEIARAVELMEAAHERGEEGIDQDAAFHAAIGRATGNQTLAELVDAISEVLRRSRQRSFEAPAAAATARADHRAILAAIEAEDPATARREMRKHLARVERLILEALD